MTDAPRVERAPLVPVEALDFWRAKGLRPAFSWQDVWEEEHAYAHTVAGVLDADVLREFQAEIDGALARGEGFATFRERMRTRLTPRGWWGPRTVTDPVTGRDKVVDFSAPRRLQTTFWSNVRAARAAGQWERAQRTKDALPFILYVRTTAAEPRPEHLRWAGTILPVDHPFWRTHWPPNGWGCKCAVRQITGREAADRLARDGYADAPPDDGPPRTFVNRRTGEVSRVPAGIDPGWHTNPGLARARTLTRRLDEALTAAPPDAASALVERLWQSSFVRVLPQLAEQVWAPAGVAPKLARALAAGSALVAIDNRTMARKFDRARYPGHPTLEQHALLPQLLAEGTVVDDDDGPAKRAVFAEIDGLWWRVIVARSRAGYLQVRSFHRVDRARALKALSKGDVAGRT